MGRRLGHRGVGAGVRATRSLLRALVSAVVLVVACAGPGAVWAEGEQPYQVSEFAVHVSREMSDRPAISGSWVVWHEGAGEVRRIYGRNLATGQDFMFTTANDYGEFDLDGDLVVTSENALGQKGIFGYRLASGFSRLEIASLAGGSGFFRSGPRVSGNTVVWAEGNDAFRGMDIYGHDLSSGRTFPICTDPAQQERPAVSGNLVVWADARHRGGTSLAEFDLYGYDLAARREFRITPRPEAITGLAISGNVVVWCAQRDRAYRVLAYDVSTGQETALANLGYETGGRGIDVSGNLVVWSARTTWRYGDDDVYGYDLTLKKQFVVSRAIGAQQWPRIAGRTVVWTDGRHRNLGKYDANSDIYGATLTAASAPVPPVIGAPEAVDARIQIVWPHGGVPVTQADRANVGAYLVLPGTLRPAPCQWHPQVQLWQALNNGPARLAGIATQQAYTPLWEFNGLDVSAARDPRNRIFFFITVAGTPSRSNVWAHAADARTYFPQQDVPTAVAAPGAAVDARIEIVWPHGGVPVGQAQLANVTAALFRPETLVSVAADWNPTVRLWRSLNQAVAEPVAVGAKRLVTVGGLTYPVWDFHNVDVSAARDPANKYYFRLSVDGVETFSNVWAHGVDARTYFPEKDTLEGSCS